MYGTQITILAYAFHIRAELDTDGITRRVGVNPSGNEVVRLVPTMIVTMIVVFPFTVDAHTVITGIPYR